MSAEGSQSSAPGRPPMAANVQHHLDRFQVFKWDSSSEDLPVPCLPEDTEFLVVATGAHLGLRLTENKSGRAALQKQGLLLCKSWAKRGLVTRPTEDSTTEDADSVYNMMPAVRDMEHIVNYYIHKLRNGFFTIITGDIPGRHAMISRRGNGWARESPYTVLTDLGQDFDPKDLGVLFISWPGQQNRIPFMLVARDEIRQGNQDALPVFHQLMMALSVTFSHEAAHGFTRFLSYLLGIQQGTCTPSSVNLNPNSGSLPHAPRQTKKPKKAGEAGRVFEFLTFGGTIDIESLPDTGSQSSDSTDPFDGTCVVIRYSADDKSKTRKVEDEVIASFMAAPEDFTIEDMLSEGPTCVIDEHDLVDSDDEADEAADVENGYCVVKARIDKVLTSEQLDVYSKSPMFRLKNTRTLEHFANNPADLIGAFDCDLVGQKE